LSVFAPSAFAVLAAVAAVAVLVAVAAVVGLAPAGAAAPQPTVTVKAVTSEASARVPITSIPLRCALRMLRVQTVAAALDLVLPPVILL
jgi:hypothetical protein